MTNRSFSNLALLLLVVVSAAAAFAQTAAPAADVAAKVDEYMNARLEAKGFGGAVLIMKGGKPLVANGYGLADADKKSPIKADTKTGLYWAPGTTLYDEARAEIWFASEELARTNGFQRAN